MTLTPILAFAVFMVGASLWTPDNISAVIRELVVLVTAITALVKVFRLEGKSLGTDTRIDDVKKDVRQVQSNLATVAAISTPTVVKPVDFEELMKSLRGEPGEKGEKGDRGAKGEPGRDG